MDKSLFVNIYNYKNPMFPFCIIVGGRGTGKTYSALSGALDKKIVTGKFVLMRRTGQEMDMLLDSDQRGEGLNPFKVINRNLNRNVGMKSIHKNLAGIYNREVDADTGKYTYSSDTIGYGVALSTMASIRGVDLSDCTDIIDDEFIAEKHQKLIGAGTKEFDALMNAYETMNRNRELEGQPPMNLWMLSNSNDIYNPIFVGLGIVDDIEKMIQKGKTDKYYKSKGLQVHILPDTTEFTKQKAQTALYKLTEGTNFSEMALNNKFSYNDFSYIGYKNIIGYIPICHVDDMYIWKKKGSREYYITHTKANVKGYDSARMNEVKKFNQDIGSNLSIYHTNSLVTFETYDIKTRMLDIFY